MRLDQLPAAVIIEDHADPASPTQAEQQLQNMLDERGYLVLEDRRLHEALAQSGARWVVADLNVTHGSGDTPAALIAVGGPEMGQVDIEVDMADLTDRQTGDLDLDEIAESCHQLSRYYDNTVASRQRDLDNHAGATTGAPLPSRELDADHGHGPAPTAEDFIERSEDLFSEAEQLGLRTETIPGEPEPAYDASLGHTRQRLQQTAANASSEADRLAAQWDSAPTPERRQRWDYVNRLNDFSSRAALLAETPTADPFDDHSAQVRETVAALRGRLENHTVEHVHTGGDHEAIAIYPADDEPQDYRVMVSSADGGPLDNTGWHVGVEYFDPAEHGAATGLVVDQNWEVFTSYDDADAAQVPSQVVRGIDQVRDLADAPDQSLDVDLDQHAHQQAVESQTRLNQQPSSGPSF
ncbi:hypothetical protein [Nesterenkonia halobia]|uniref:Uncharacterized protein n=1 Tax=Nesterenkonia halobia TaxID=37922 RepID=A0ABP6R7B3_9MICC